MSDSGADAGFEFHGAARDPAYARQLEEFADNPAVMLELSSRCNFFCDYCRSPTSDRQKSTMSRELFDHILPQLKGITQRRIRFHIDGEPMLHPRFLELSQMVNQQGFRLAIASNASALRNEFLAIDMDLFVHLSASAEEHARRARGSFEHYLEKIRKYLAGWLEGPAKQNIEIKIFFNSLESLNGTVLLGKRRFIAEFVAGLGIDASACWLAPNWQPELLHTNSSGYSLRIRFQQTTEGGLYPNIGGLHWPGGVPPERGFCDSPWKILAIHSDGSVGFCCVDITGKTIFTDPEEIWRKPLDWIWRHHPRLLEARQGFLAGRVNLKICQECLEPIANRENYPFAELFPGDPFG
jgi:hypothetical protein